MEPESVEAIAQIERRTQALNPHPVEGGQRYLVRVPEGYDVREFNFDTDEYRDHPKRKVGTAKVYDAAAFVSYLDKHEIIDETEIWADPTAFTLTAAIDAHAADHAGWNAHRLEFKVVQTPAWQHWAGGNRRLMQQRDFAEHLEDRLPDFLEPTGAEIMEIVQTFKANTKVQFDSSERLSTGQHSLVYHEEINATAGRKGQMEIPERFKLGVKPFEGTSAFGVTARLRFRIEGGNLVLSYVLDQPEDIMRAAFDEIVHAVRYGEIDMLGQLRTTHEDGEPIEIPGRTVRLGRPTS